MRKRGGNVRKNSIKSEKTSSTVFDDAHGIVDVASGVPEAQQKVLDVRLTRAHKTGCLDLSHATLENAIGFNYIQIPIQVFDKYIGSKIQHLWLTNHRISILPSELGLLKQLKTLGLGGNQLDKLPESIGKLERLEKLYLEKNLLISLPESFGKLQHLTELMLDENKFQTFPRPVFQLKKLIRLGLSQNEISQIPTEISHLRNLLDLNLDFNRIGPDIPSELLSLNALRLIGLKNNQFESESSDLLSFNIKRISGDYSHQANLETAIFYRDPKSNARAILKARAKKLKWKKSNRLL